MERRKIQLLVVALLLVTLAWFTVCQWGVLRPESVVTVENFADISDLAWLEERQTLIAVSDENLIGELDLDGNVLALRSYPGYDLESVSVIAGRSDRVLVMDECGGRLLWFSIPQLDLVRVQALPVEALVSDSCNKQIEGMAFVADGLVLANEYPASLQFFDRKLPRLRSSVSLDTKTISEVIALYDGTLLVVSRDAGLRLYSAEGEALGPWRAVSEGFIEGGVFVPGRGLVLCVDRDPSKLLFFPAIRNDKSIKGLFLDR